MLNFSQTITVTLSTLLLTACGSEVEQGGSLPPIMSNPNVGIFVDSGVQGLEYTKINGHKYITGNGGTFYYLTGEPILFHIGKLEIGTTIGLATATPKDIVTYKNINKEDVSFDDLDTSIHAAEVNNRVRLLMSLDSDQNPDNGIEINQTIRDKSKEWSTPDYALSAN